MVWVWGKKRIFSLHYAEWWACDTSAYLMFHLQQNRELLPSEGNSSSYLSGLRINPYELSSSTCIAESRVSRYTTSKSVIQIKAFVVISWMQWYRYTKLSVNEDSHWGTKSDIYPESFLLYTPSIRQGKRQVLEVRECQFQWSCPTVRWRGLVAS